MDLQATKAEDDAKAMPPPRLPRVRLLDSEIERLKQCLQNAMLKTGQVYGFYGDTRRLGLSKFINQPPQALTSSLGRELENYDQLCDAIESHLLRAIAVLQRDLHTAERKQEIARLEAETQNKKQEALQEPQPSQGFQFAEPPPAELLSTHTRNSPTHHGTGQINARRPSAISISSLQRPTIPLKLDLSSSSMRITSEEGSGMYSSGLASPVTLAPKSARPVGPNEFPDDFMVAFTNPVTVDQPVIDLTLTENNNHRPIKTTMDPTAGNSSDKPIELDLDSMDMDMSMKDIFGDNPESSIGTGGVGGMFEIPGSSVSSGGKAKDAQFVDLTTQDIFSLSHDPVATSQNIRGAVDPSTPATLLAVGFSHNLTTSSSLENNTGLSGPDQPFDMASLGDLADLPDFSSAPEFHIPDMDAFLNMGTGNSGSSSESPGKVAGSIEQTTAS